MELICEGHLPKETAFRCFDTLSGLAHQFHVYVYFPVFSLPRICSCYSNHSGYFYHPRLMFYRCYTS